MTFSINSPLPRLRSAALARIDAAAGAARSVYITSTPGQETIYSAKLSDATAYIAAGYPIDTAQYIWVNEEANAVGLSPQAMADTIVAASERCAIALAKIEGIRASAKKSIANADTPAAIYALERDFMGRLTDMEVR